jgi:hypothetical protein
VTAVDLVSVVIPVFDRAHCVGEAVQSVLDQTHPSVECLVVDDGSTDDTLAVLRATYGNDPRVRILHQEHGGVSRARNLGIDHATGRYLTFLDSDDLMVPGRIERQLDHLLGHGAADAVIGRQEQVLAGPASRPDWLERHPEWWDECYHTSILVETERVRAVGGFDDGLSLGEDLDLMVRLAGAGVRIVPLDEVVVTRRYFGDNLTYGMGDDDHRAMLRAVRQHLARRRATVAPAGADAAGSGDLPTPPASTGAPLGLDLARAALARAHERWDDVVERATGTTRSLRIAGVDLTLAVYGEALAEVLLPGFDGLEAASGPPRALVGCWDAAETGCGVPPRPPLGGHRRYRSTIRRAGRPVAEVEWSPGDVFRAADRDAARHLLAVRTASTLALSEGGAPLRRQLSWALGEEVTFVHAGAVGDADGVALLMGPGGSGKSSTSVACLRAGMGFVADDYCLVSSTDSMVHQLYTTVRLCAHDVGRFADVAEPAVAATVPDPDSGPHAKALYHVHASRPAQLLRSAPARAVIVVEPTGGGRPDVSRITPGQALLAVAPSTLWQMNIDPARELAGLRRLVTSVPCYRLRLGHDRDANPPVIRSILAGRADGF